MKNIIFTVLSIVLSVTAFAQSPKYGPVPYKDLKETIGEIYLVPKLSAYMAMDGYSIKKVSEPGKVLYNADIADKKLTLVAINDEVVHFKDSLGTLYTDDVFEGTLFDLCLVSDIENARKLFLNKKLWLNKPYIIINPDSIRSDKNKVSNIRFEPVTVFNVTAGTGDCASVRFWVKTDKNESGFLDMSVSGTNAGFKQEYFFDKFFFTEDPKLKYHFSPATWQNLKKGNIDLGMEKDAVLLAIGMPTDMNNSTATDGLDQWVYSTQYLYFRNNKLVDIRNR